MNIKEYIKIQADKCQNEVMKGIFVDLVDKFYPKPKPVTEVKAITWQPAAKTEESSFSKRKVRVHQMPNGKPCIGLIDEDGLGIKLPNNVHLDFMLVDDSKIYYYYGLEHLFYKASNSRIVYMIDKDTYDEHRANVECIKDYILLPTEKVRID